MNRIRSINPLIPVTYLSNNDEIEIYNSFPNKFNFSTPEEKTSPALVTTLPISFCSILLECLLDFCLTRLKFSKK